MMDETMETLNGFGHTQSALMKLLLRNKDGMTVDQIAEGLSVTRTAVNQHLASLERDGYIYRKHVVPTGGRPSRVYGLSERGLHLFPKNYDAFSLMTMEAMINSLGSEQVKNILVQMGENLGNDLGTNLKEQPLNQRLGMIASTLKDLGYDAELEEGASSSATPTIAAYNCIYHALAQVHPEVCELDLAFLRKASGADVEHVDCMAKGANRCRFRFVESKGDTSST